jgi:hypothetical protein
VQRACPNIPAQLERDNHRPSILSGNMKNHPHCTIINRARRQEQENYAKSLITSTKNFAFGMQEKCDMSFWHFDFCLQKAMVIVEEVAFDYPIKIRKIVRGLVQQRRICYLNSLKHYMLCIPVRPADIIRIQIPPRTM